MRAWLIVLVLVACKKEQPSHGSGVAQITRPGDAQLADMAAPALDAPLDTLLDVEAIGPLKFRMNQAAAVKILGPPTHKTTPVEEGATGELASNWTWAGVTLEMMSETRTGAATVRLITVTAPATYATQRGIKIGSSKAQVTAAYPKSDEGSDDPAQYLVGSPYGGLLFVLENDAVAEILLGPLAF